MKVRGQRCLPLFVELPKGSLLNLTLRAGLVQDPQVIAFVAMEKRSLDERVLLKGFVPSGGLCGWQFAGEHFYI